MALAIDPLVRANATLVHTDDADDWLAAAVAKRFPGPLDAQHDYANPEAELDCALTLVFAGDLAFSTNPL